MDNQELFLVIPGVAENGCVYNNSPYIMRNRADLAQALEGLKEIKWKHLPKFFTFPEMQEVCATEVTIVVRDE